MNAHPQFWLLLIDGRVDDALIQLRHKIMSTNFHIILRITCCPKWLLQLKLCKAGQL